MKEKVASTLLIGMGLLLVSCAGPSPKVVNVGSNGAGGAGISRLTVKIELSDIGVNGVLLGVHVPNDFDAAICIPDFLLPSDSLGTNAVFSVRELSSGEELPMKGRGLHEPTQISSVSIVGPNVVSTYLGDLAERFSLDVGRRYLVQYEVEAFFCSSFDMGYPYSRQAYMHRVQKESGSQFFDRHSETTVRLFGSAEFTFTE